MQLPRSERRRPRWNLGRAAPGTDELIAGAQEIAAENQPSGENNRAQYQRLDGFLECRGRAIGDQRVLDAMKPGATRTTRTRADSTVVGSASSSYFPLGDVDVGCRCEGGVGFAGGFAYEMTPFLTGTVCRFESAIQHLLSALSVP